MSSPVLTHRFEGPAPQDPIHARIHELGQKIVDSPLTFEGMEQTADYLSALRNDQANLRTMLAPEHAPQTVALLAAIGEQKDRQTAAFDAPSLTTPIEVSFARLLVGGLGTELVREAMFNPTLTNTIEDLLASNFAMAGGAPPVVSLFVAGETPSPVSLFVADCLPRVIQRSKERARVAKETAEGSTATEDRRVAIASTQQRQRLSSALKTLLWRYDADLAPPLRSTLTELGSSSKEDEYTRTILSPIFRDHQKAGVIFRILDLPEKDVLSAIGQGYAQGKSMFTEWDYLEQSVVRALSLEQQQPGIVNWLHRSGRFRNFGRHSEAFLLGLYEDQNKQFGQMAFFAFSTWDNNGSSTRNSAPKLERLASQLRAKGIGIAAGEFSDPKDLQFLLRLARYTGYIASLVCVDSHAYFNKLLSHKDILEKHITGGLGEALADVTTEQSITFLCACSTAADNGLAIKISDTAYRTVIGADSSFALDRVDGDISPDGNVTLEVFPQKPSTKMRRISPQDNDATIPISIPLTAFETTHPVVPNSPLSRIRGAFRRFGRRATS